MRLLFIFIALSISNSIFAVDPIINPATSQPANGATNGSCLNFAMEFDNVTEVKQGAGETYVKNMDGTTHDTIDVGTANVVINSPTTTVQVNLNTLMRPNTQYYINKDAGFVEETSSGDGSIGFTNNSTYTFTTGDGPNLSSSTPSNGATNVGVNDNLLLTFDTVVSTTAMAIFSGNAYLYDSSDTLIETVDLTGAQTTGSGTNTLTIDWTTTLDDDETYYVQIDDSVIGNQGSGTGCPFNGISNTTTLRFSTGSGVSAPTTTTTTSSSSGTQSPFEEQSVTEMVTQHNSISTQSLDTLLSPIDNRINLLIRSYESGQFIDRFQNNLEFKYDNKILNEILSLYNHPIIIASASAQNLIEQQKYRNNPDGSKTIFYNNLTDEEKALIDSLPTIETLAERELNLLSPVNRIIDPNNVLSKNKFTWVPWVSGNLNFGDKKISGQNFKTKSRSNYLTLGFDKIIKEQNMFVGFTGTFGKGHTKASNSSDRVESDIFGLSYYNIKILDDNFYIDSVIGFNKINLLNKKYYSSNNEYKSSRNVYQGLVSVAINHESKVSNWHVSPFFKIMAAYSEFRPFKEVNNENQTIRFNESKVDTITNSLGLKLNQTYTLSNSLITPFIQFEYEDNHNNFSDVSATYSNSNTLFTYDISDNQSFNRLISTLGFDYLNTNSTNINLNYKYAKDVESNIDASSHSVNFKLNKNF